MTQKEFMVIAAAIKTYYPRDNILPTKESVSLWYDCLNDLDFAKTQESLRVYVKSNIYPPTIADIRKHYNEIMEQEKGVRRELRRIYDMTVAIYPCANCEPDVEKVYKNLISTWPENERLEAARKILHDASEYVRECELSEDGKIMKLADFLKGGDWK